MAKDGSAFAVYAEVANPVVVAGPDFEILYLNPSAEAFWQVGTGEVAGQFVMQALRLEAPDGGDLRRWAREVGYPAMIMGEPITCRTSCANRPPRLIRLRATRFQHERTWLTLLSVLEGAVAEQDDAATSDPLTTLPNRRQWQREFAEHDGRPGVVVFFDLDNLKAINDLQGHRHGDEALLATGRAIRENAPAGALAVRYGGDEFLVVVHDMGEEGVSAWARGIAEGVAAAVPAQVGTVPVRVDYGVAAYSPGGLRAAVERADEALYEHKGMLLRSRAGGRIVLTSEARRRVLVPGSEGRRAPGEFARGFGSQFDTYFRQMYARAVDEAREFVAFVNPEPGSAVVEVGAGSGRITIDGGLAHAIGDQGQLLVTDASPAQVDVARQRAEAMDLSWVRFLVAPVEDLPVASGTVDLAIGAAFLHFTDPPAAIGSMARIVRPGGRVAILSGLSVAYGPAWERALVPVARTLQAHGRPFQFPFLAEQALRDVFAGAGLAVERTAATGEARLVFPSSEVAIGVARQARIASLLLQGIPADACAAAEQEFEVALGHAIEDLGLEAAEISIPALYVVARRPG